jgi:hypothetical protein
LAFRCEGFVRGYSGDRSICRRLPSGWTSHTRSGRSSNAL